MLGADDADPERPCTVHDSRLRASADQVWTLDAFTFLINFNLSPLDPSSILFTLCFTRLTFRNLASQYWPHRGRLDFKIRYLQGPNHFLEPANSSIRNAIDFHSFPGSSILCANLTSLTWHHSPPIYRGDNFSSFNALWPEKALVQSKCLSTKPPCQQTATSVSHETSACW